MNDAGYAAVGAVTGAIAALITLIGGWWYAIANFGWFLGLSLGWIPSAIFALVILVIVRFLWPVLACAAIYVVAFWHPWHHVRVRPGRDCGAIAGTAYNSAMADDGQTRDMRQLIEQQSNAQNASSTAQSDCLTSNAG